MLRAVRTRRSLNGSRRRFVTDVGVTEGKAGKNSDRLDPGLTVPPGEDERRRHPTVPA